MSTLNDLNGSNGSLVEYRLIEQKIWQYQDGKLGIAEMLSWPFGRYALGLLHSKTMHGMTNETESAKFIPHMVERISEQEQYLSNGTLIYGTRSGESKEVKDSKGNIKLESSFQKTQAFLNLFEKSGNVDSDSALWRNAWRIAYAQATRFLTKADAQAIAKQFNVSPVILAHAVKFWQFQSPANLNKTYQQAKPVAVTGKAKNQTVANSAPTVTTPVENGNKVPA